MQKLFLASAIDVSAKHIVKQLAKPASSYRVVFINTAAEVETGDKQWVKQDRRGLTDAGLSVFDYTLTDKTPKDIEADLKDVNWIHVNGGNTFYLLLQSRKSGFDKYITQAVNQGVIYSGSSAGSIIASPDIEIAKNLETKPFHKKLKSFKGFNLVDLIVLPHWGNQEFKDLYLNQRLDIAYQPENKIVLLNDFQYVQVTGKGYKIIDIRKD